MRYILENNFEKHKYIENIEFGCEVITDDYTNAMKFYSKEDASIFNKDYLGNNYHILEIKED